MPLAYLGKSLLHSKFILILSLALLAVGLTCIPLLGLNALATLVTYISAGCYLFLFGVFSCWAFCMLAIVSILAMPSQRWRLAWAILIFVSSLIADLSYRITGVYINDGTLDLFWNARFSSGAFLTANWLELLKSGLRSIPLPMLIIFLKIKIPVRSALLQIPPLLAFLGLFLFFQCTERYGLSGLPPQFAGLAVLLGWATSNDPPVEKNVVDITLSKPTAVPHILLIVDESIRGDYLDINGANGVTPYLKSIQSKIINFGIASSGNNCTATSNAFLRMGFNPRNALESSDDLRHHPTIWKFAEAAGYKTYFIDNQRNGGQLQNYMDAKEASLIDNFHQYQVSTPRLRRDLASIELIHKGLLESSSSFIYVDKAGAHFHYETAYPEDWHKFNPHLAAFEPAINRDKMINSYKNAVAWSVDEFFKMLLPKLDLKNTLVIYTSDHGQNLLDDGTSITHCHIANPRDLEALVPLFVITENPQLLAKFSDASHINFNRANHFQIFPTLLELMGFEPKAVEDLYYPSLFNRIEESPGFTSAEVIKQFGKSPKWRRLTWHPVSFFGKGD